MSYVKRYNLLTQEEELERREAVGAMGAGKEKEEASAPS